MGIEKAKLKVFTTMFCYIKVHNNHLIKAHNNQLTRLVVLPAGWRNNSVIYHADGDQLPPAVHKL